MTRTTVTWTLPHPGRRLPAVDEYTMPTDLVTPNPDDDTGTPQSPRKRLFGKAAVPTKATRRERKQLRAAHQRVDDDAS